MTIEDMEYRIAVRLRESAELPISAALDHRIRTALRTMPLEVRRFALPVMALGLAIAATLAMTVSLALSFAAAGAAESGVLIAIVLVVGYLGVSSVVALPLLFRFRTVRRGVGVTA
jgi:membrane protein YdbS with pleckstrin-like domain